MQAQSTRGVQAYEVAQAADALIAEGQRPTIERVRLKIGRGSPNTIAPLLDGWFLQLAPRLGVAVSDAGAPAPVHQLAVVFWEQALAYAQDQAQRAMAEREAALREQQEALERERLIVATQATQWGEREQLHQESQRRLEQDLVLARSTAQDWQTKAEALQAQWLDAQRVLGEATQAHNAERRRHDEQLQRLLTEQHRQADIARAEQQRLLTQIDQGRQELKRLEKRESEVQQQHEATVRALERASADREHHLQASLLELASLREREKGLTTRLQEVQAQLVPTPRSRVARARSGSQGPARSALVPSRK